MPERHRRPALVPDFENHWNGVLDPVVGDRDSAGELGGRRRHRFPADEQCPSDEHRGGVGRDGLARQPDHRGVVHQCRGHGSAGTERHAGEQPLVVGEHVRDVVGGPDARAAGGEDGVVTGRRVGDGARDPIRIVRDGPRGRRLAAPPADEAGEEARVPVGLATLVDLGAGGDDGDRRRAADPNRLDPDVGQQRRVSRGEPVAGREQPLVRRRGGSPTDHVGAARETGVRESVVRHGRVLARDDGVGPLGQRCACRDRDGFVGVDSWGSVLGGDATDDRSRALVGGRDGVAVHRGVVRRRHVAGRAHRLGERSTGALGGSNGFGRERPEEPGSVFEEPVDRGRARHHLGFDHDTVTANRRNTLSASPRPSDPARSAVARGDDSALGRS